MKKLVLSPPSRAHKRSRQTMTLLFNKTQIHIFRGNSIEEVCVSELLSSHKNGKWSTVDYTVYLAEGVSCSHISEDWETGRYVMDSTTIKKIKESLGLSEVSDSVVKEFLRKEMPGLWDSYNEYNQKLAALEEIGIEETQEYEFHHEFRNNRCGHLHLLIDGQVWNEYDNPMPEKVVIKQADHYSGRGGGGCNYKLILPIDVLTEELYESDYGDDALDTRGYERTSEGWAKPVVENTAELPWAELPWAALKGLKL